MPPSRSDDNLFESSTMSFGEHLEELRTCLFKSLIGLVIGFGIGLFAGPWVVDAIQTPLQDALAKYYEGQSADRIGAMLIEQQEGGEPLPDGTALEDPQKVEEFIKKQHFLAQEVFVDPDTILRQLKKRYPDKLDDVSLPPPSDAESAISEDDLMPILLWHRTEDDPRVKAKSFNAHEAFTIYIKASLLVGALLSSPYIFYQIWTFVAAGLYPHEKKFVRIFAPFSLTLFLLGAAMAFFFVFEPVLNFLFGINKALGIDIDPRISEWLSFVLVLPLGFGVSFQLPLVMLFLERIGIFDISTYLSKFRVAILVIFIISMFLTPADPTSMFLMAIPLTILYFGGILLCKYMPKSRSPFDED
ncbi:MAG: twin-arginine translocase subunit TatC [Pirellulales bacterium]|nr:twin-arginine translocase subunit TatC [Pirellulales bacterium]